MKAMIYTAVGLIACASVFGLSDYLSAKKEGKLVNYTEQSVAPDVVEVKTIKDKVEVQDKKQTEVSDAIEIKNTVKADPKPAKVKRKRRPINFESFSRAAPTQGLKK